jgi:hypothetical protein
MAVKTFFTNRDPDILEQEVGGGGLMLVSLPFWAVGVFYSAFLPAEAAVGYTERTDQLDRRKRNLSKAPITR